MTHNNARAIEELARSRKHPRYIAIRLGIPLASVLEWLAAHPVEREPAGQGRGKAELQRKVRA